MPGGTHAASMAMHACTLEGPVAEIARGLRAALFSLSLSSFCCSSYPGDAAAVSHLQIERAVEGAREMSATDTEHRMACAQEEARAEAAQEARRTHRRSAAAAASAFERGACQLEASLSRVLAEAECGVYAIEGRVSAAAASLFQLHGCVPVAPAPLCWSCGARCI